MSRSTPEWIGKTPDEAIPPRVRVRVFDRYEGRCQCGCSRKIRAGERWDCDHAVALANEGENRESNLRPLLVEHHKAKTAADVAEKSRVYRKRARHLGLRPASRLPGSRNSPLKKRVDGTVVRRHP